MKTLASWLDFWTTNSTIGYSDWVEHRLINLSEDKQADRTVLFADTEENEFVIWVEWMRRFTSGSSGRLLQSLKSFLWTKEEISTILLGKEHSLTEVLGIIISEIKQRLEGVLNESVQSVVMGRPVHFNDTNKELDAVAQKRLESAARLAWFKNIEFQFEPLAAAKAYQETLLEDKNETVLIVDLGGGTSDFSLLRVNKVSMDILWNSGVYIGWDAFDQRLSYDFFCNFLWKGSKYSSLWKSLDVPTSFFYMLSDWKNIHELSTKKVTSAIDDIYRISQDKERFGRIQEISHNHRLWYEYFSEVEKSKRALSKCEHTEGVFEFFNYPFHYNLSRKDFEVMIHTSLDTVMVTMMEAISQAGTTTDKIDTVFLTGGSSLLPIVTSRIRELFKNWRVVFWDSFNSVGYGLTIEAKERFLR